MTRSIVVTVPRLPSSDTVDQITHALVDELARVVSDERLAKVILNRAGFPKQRVPSFTTALVFWDEVLEAARHGVVLGGIQAIIDAAAREYPKNAIFALEAGAAPGVAEGVEPAGQGPTERPATKGQLSRWFFFVGVIAFFAALGFAIWGVAWSLAASATSGPAVWLITFYSLFAEQQPPVSESLDLLVAFEDANGRPAEVNGEFVLVVGGEEYRCDPRGRVSCRIPTLPIKEMPQELIVRLEDSSHEVVHGPYAFGSDGNVTIVVERVQGSSPAPTTSVATAVTKSDDTTEKRLTAGKKAERVHQPSAPPNDDEPSPFEPREACVIHISDRGEMIANYNCSLAIVDTVSKLRITQIGAGQDLVLRNTSDQNTNKIADQGHKTIEIGESVLCMRHTWSSNKRSSFRFSMMEGRCQ